MTWLIPGWRPPGSGGGTPRIPPAAQNAFRSIIRIVTPVVNGVNRVVQGLTGGRGGIAQLARGLTGLVNRAYQRATGQAWGAQGGGGQAGGGAGAADGTGGEDTPLLPPPTPDIGESNDRLRTLNEEEEETRSFNWQEFFGDDFTLEDIGDSMRDSAEWFLRFVRGEVDEELPLLTQIRTLFEEARGRLEGEVEPSPVDENWANLTMEMLQERFGDDWTTVYDDINELPAEELITLIKNEASQQFGITFSESLVGLPAEEVVALYREELERRHEEIVNSGIGILARDRDSHEEIRRAYEFWTQIQDTFGVQQDVTMDVSEFAIHELGLPQTTTPAEADARIDVLIEEYIESGLIDPEAVQGMTREQIAYAYYEVVIGRLTDSEGETSVRLMEINAELLNLPNPVGALGLTAEEAEVALQPILALEQEREAIIAELTALRTQADESRNLVLAFNRMYTPPQTPYGEILLFVLGFTALDQYVSGFDFARSVASGDWLGAGLSALDFVTPGRLRPVADALRGQIDNLVQGVGRQIDEFGQDIDNFGQLLGDGGRQPAYAGGLTGSGTPLDNFVFSSNLPNWHPRGSTTVKDPTGANAVILGRELETLANTSRSYRVPQTGEQAHHIVPSTDRLADQAQNILQAAKVGVNSAYNGIGLGDAVHRLTFKHEYIIAVNDAVVRLGTNPTQAQVIDLLDKIADRLDSLQQFSNNPARLTQEWNTFVSWLGQA